MHPEELQDTVTVPPRNAVPAEGVIEIQAASAPARDERRTASVASLPGAARCLAEEARRRASSGSSKSNHSSVAGPLPLCGSGGALRPAGEVETRPPCAEEKEPAAAVVAPRGTAEASLTPLCTTGAARVEEAVKAPRAAAGPRSARPLE